MSSPPPGPVWPFFPPAAPPPAEPPPVTPSWVTPPRQDEARFGVRCPRCARTQPGQEALQTPARYAGPPAPQHCVYCGAPLFTARWVANPPPGMGPPPRVRRVTRPYDGPPRYGQTHPLWGFPPVAKAPPGADEPAAAVPPAPLRLTSVAVVSALATALTSLLAAGAEVWRYRLMLAGRTEVLPGRPVSLSNALVAAASWVALALAVVTLLTATAVVRRWHLAGAHRGGFRAPRSPVAIAARMIVPGWNLYGAGQVIAEAARLIRRSAPGTVTDADRDAERRDRTLLLAAWLSWLMSGVVAIGVAAVSLLPVFFARWAGSNQLAANLVLWHVVVDVLAALAAVLAAEVLARLRTAWLGGKARSYDGWLVAPPQSSPRNREPADLEPGDLEPALSSMDRGVTTAVPEPEMATAELGGPGSAGAGPADVIDGGAQPVELGPAAGRRSADARAHPGQHRRR